MYPTRVLRMQPSRPLYYASPVSLPSWGPPQVTFFSIHGHANVLSQKEAQSGMLSHCDCHDALEDLADAIGSIGWN